MSTKLIEHAFLYNHIRGTFVDFYAANTVTQILVRTDFLFSLNTSERLDLFGRYSQGSFSRLTQV